MSFKGDWTSSIMKNSNELLKCEKEYFIFELNIAKTGSGSIRATNNQDTIKYTFNIYVPILAYINDRTYGELVAKGNTESLLDIRKDIIRIINDTAWVPSVIKQNITNPNKDEMKKGIDKEANYSTSESEIARNFLDVYEMGELLFAKNVVSEEDIIKVYRRVKNLHDEYKAKCEEKISEAKVLAAIDVQKIKQKH